MKLNSITRSLGPVYMEVHGGPQVGEVTRLSRVTRLSIYSRILMWSRLHDRWGDLPHVTSPIWCPPPPCKPVLNLKVSAGVRAGRECGEYNLVIFKMILQSQENENDFWELRWVSLNFKRKICHFSVFSTYEREKHFD